MDEELKCPYCDGVQMEEPDGDWDIELSPWECEHCGKVAVSEGRDFVGIEIKSEYCEMSKNRIGMEDK